MHGSNERTVRSTSTGRAGSATGVPTRADYTGPGLSAAQRGPKFQVDGITIW